jgi:hypothetical protein
MAQNLSGLFLVLAIFNGLLAFSTVMQGLGTFICPIASFCSFPGHCFYPWRSLVYSFGEKKFGHQRPETVNWVYFVSSGLWSF